MVQNKIFKLNYHTNLTHEMHCITKTIFNPVIIML